MHDTPLLSIGRISEFHQPIIMAFARSARQLSRATRALVA
jgi:hypothetical protein